ncbi:UNVERIFIED_CONTAM: hypothetical protein FKN15_019394 [Acipenser sinensis]
MLHRTKYNRFRNESVTSVDELLHSLSMNSKVSAAPETSAAPPYPTSAEVLHADQEDAPTTLCTLIHKVSHLKFSGTGSLSGIKNLSSAVKDLAVSKLQGSSSTPSTTAGAVDNTCNPASTPLCSQQDLSKMSTGKKIKLEEMHLGGEDWNQSGSVVNKPSRGWLHSNEKILGPGVTYIVKPPSKALSSILGKSNLQFAGMSITLNISTSSLNLMTPDSKQGIRLNPLWMRCSTRTACGNPLRSWLACFSSDRLQYVNQRQTCAPGPNSLKDRQCSEPARNCSTWRLRQGICCHGPLLSSSDVICQPEGKTQLPKMGEVPTYVNTQHIDVQALVALQANSDTVINGTAGAAKDSPRKDIFDMKPFEDAIRNRSPVLNKTASIDNSSPLLVRAAAFNVKEELKLEPWYHGEMSRKEAEQLLKDDGDFLVRKSTTNPGSYVLTGMHNGQSKHLLLVDPEGTWFSRSGTARYNYPSVAVYCNVSTCGVLK